MEYKMSAKIFYRERVKNRKGQQAPRFRITAVYNLDLKVFAKHLRKKEIEQLAEATGAKLVKLKRDKNSKKKKD